MNAPVQILQSLQTGDFAVWVQTSIWGYQIILTLHSIGLAFLVGLLMVIDLRILGLASAVPLFALRRAMLVVWAAFALNAITGVMLFIADAERFFFNHMFRFKLASILVGMFLAVLINNSVLRAPRPLAASSEIAPTPVRAKALAGLSLAMWVAAIILGRLVAYHQ